MHDADENGALTVERAIAAVPEIAAQVNAWQLEAVSPDGTKRIRIDTTQPIGAYVANVREAIVTDEGVKPEAVLGVVTDSYALAQTREQFETVGKIVAEQELVVETAISLFDGRVNTLLVRTPESVRIVGDEVVPYILVVNSFDRSRALTFASTPVRVVCANTLRFAMGNRSTRAYSLRHTGSIDDKLSEARRAMGFAESYIAQLAEYAESARAYKLTTGDLKRLLVATFPMPKQRENEDAPVFKRRELATREAQLQVREIVKTADNLAEHRGTAWAYLNGVIEWTDHTKHKLSTSRDDAVKQRSAERRMRNIALSDSPEIERAELAVASLVTA
jgi:phage/plasmid-like protein (TIGR03299 family)